MLTACKNDWQRRSLGSAFIFHSYAEGLGFDSLWQWWHNHACVPAVIGTEGSCRNGISPVGRDQPKLVNFVGLERLHVAGKKDQSAFFRDVGSATLRLWGRWTGWGFH